MIRIKILLSTFFIVLFSVSGTAQEVCSNSILFGFNATYTDESTIIQTVRPSGIGIQYEYDQPFSLGSFYLGYQFGNHNLLHRITLEELTFHTTENLQTDYNDPIPSPPLGGEKVKSISMAYSYTMSKGMVLTSDSLFRFDGGLTFEQRLQYLEFFPASSGVFPANSFSSVLSLVLSPRFSYKVSELLSLDLRLGFYILEFNYTREQIADPLILYEDTLITDLVFHFLPTRFRGQFGFSFSLN